MSVRPTAVRIQGACIIPLLNLDPPVNLTPMPREVAAFLREASRRIERFRQASHIPAFVPSDYSQTYFLLRALAEWGQVSGNLFCEWGSGFGVVSCLAAMLEFNACGIEIEAELVSEAERLAADFDVPVDFIHGSFIPRGARLAPRTHAGFDWLTIEDAGTAPPDVEPDNFDVIFAYPWPDEEKTIEVLFERYARAGAMLLTYHGGEDLRLRRKQPNEKKQRRVW